MGGGGGRRVGWGGGGGVISDTLNGSMHRSRTSFFFLIRSAQTVAVAKVMDHSPFMKDTGCDVFSLSAVGTRVLAVSSSERR